jgi:hypothetical protein
MKTITIKVPEGIYKLAQSIAFQQDKRIEDFVADGLADSIHSAMGTELRICPELEEPCLN